GLMADAEVTVAEGCQIWSTVPEPPAGWLRDPVTGKPGVHLEFAAADGTVLRTEHRSATTLAWWDGVPPGIGWGEGGSIVLHGSFLPDWTGPYVIGAAGVGHLTITVDGVVVADRPTAVPHDPVEAMTRPGQVRAGLELQAGREVSLRVRFRPAADGEGPLGMRLGIERAMDDDATLAAAVDAARNSDVAVVVVGSAELTESEGFDRTSLKLPGRQDDLVSQVAAANPRTIVVINSGMPVLMPWASDVAAIMQAWLPGQCMGEALADVLFGDAEPGGRLPVTLPVSEADCPVLDAIPVNGVLEYGEGLLVGYRGYDAQGVAPLFPFGHGLGYTSWHYEVVQALTTDYRPARDLDLRVVVRNTGPRHGKEVIQAYLAGPPGEPGRPVRALAAFGIASAGPGERAEVALRIPARLFARWDTDLGTWIWPGVPFTVQVGRSSRDLPLSLPVPAR
ncbi:MAG TPA: glycoside hydrolase family 3 C-terminal domain-containing protein, partial [Streptosporangiaceae bacterium]